MTFITYFTVATAAVGIAASLIAARFQIRGLSSDLSDIAAE